MLEALTAAGEAQKKIEHLPQGPALGLTVEQGAAAEQGGVAHKRPTARPQTVTEADGAARQADVVALEVLAQQSQRQADYVATFDRQDQSGDAQQRSGHGDVLRTQRALTRPIRMENSRSFMSRSSSCLVACTFNSNL